MTIEDKREALSAMYEAQTGFQISNAALDEWTDAILADTDDWQAFRWAWYCVAENYDRPPCARVRAAYRERLRQQAADRAAQAEADRVRPQVSPEESAQIDRIVAEVKAALARPGRTGG